MSHEFLITDARSPSARELSAPYALLARLEKGQAAHFQGYADGALYKAFGMEQFYAGASGSFDGQTITRSEAQAGLQAAIELLTSYPDPRRADDLKRYLAEVVMPAPEEKRFYVHFY